MMLRTRFTAGPWWRVGAVLTVLALLGSPALAGEGTVDPSGSGSRGVLGPAIRFGGPASTGDEWEPAAAANTSDGTFLAVWADGRTADSTGGDIRAQLISAAGERLGPNFKVSRSDAGEGNPEVAFNPDAGEYLVVWVDRRDRQTRGADIYGQLVSSNGARLGGNFRVCGPRLVGADASPEVVYNATSDEYLVVWRDSTSGIEHVHAQRISDEGTRIGFTLTITGWAGQEVSNPEVAWNSQANTYMVVWGDSRRSGQIFGQRLSAMGRRLGGNFRVSGSAADPGSHPAVAYNSSANQFLVVWDDHRNYTTIWPRRGTEIYGQRFASNGAWLGINVSLSGPTYATAPHMLFGAHYPEVVYDSDANRYLVAWEDHRWMSTDVTWGGPPEVYGQVVSAIGTRLGDNVHLGGGIVLCSGYWEHRQDLAYNPAAGEFLVVWEAVEPPPMEDGAGGPEGAILDSSERATCLAGVYGRLWTF